MPKSTLTDAHRVILTAAGARESGLVLPLPKSLKRPRAELDKLVQDLLDRALVAQRPAADGEPIWTTTDANGRMTLVVADAGLVEVGITELASGSSIEELPEKSTPARRKKAPNADQASKNARVAPTTKTDGPRLPTKLELLVEALRPKKGATIAELMEITGWQPHSVRGAISGSLKKKLSLNVTSKTVAGRGRVYRIEAGSAK